MTLVAFLLHHITVLVPVHRRKFLNIMEHCMVLFLCDSQASVKLIYSVNCYIFPFFIFIQTQLLLVTLCGLFCVIVHRPM